MNTTVIVVNDPDVIEMANLSQAFINHLSEMVDGSRKSKTRKVRKTRDWTDEERAAFGTRTIAGRKGKALAESKAKVVRKKDPLTKLAEEITKNSTKVLESLAIKALMPGLGQKVIVKPGAE